MGFTSTVASTQQATLSGDMGGLIYGTMQMGTTWGVIKTARLKRTGDLSTLPDGKGATRAALLANPRTEASIEVIWEATQAGPSLGALVTIPHVSATGMVIDMEGAWEENGYRGLTLMITS